MSSGLVQRGIETVAPRLDVASSSATCSGSAADEPLTRTGAILWHTLVRPWEEQAMRARFGAAFDACRAAVRCWLPRMSLPPRVGSGA